MKVSKLENFSELANKILKMVLKKFEHLQTSFLKKLNIFSAKCLKLIKNEYIFSYKAKMPFQFTQFSFNLIKDELIILGTQHSKDY